MNLQIRLIIITMMIMFQFSTSKTPTNNQQTFVINNNNINTHSSSSRKLLISVADIEHFFTNTASDVFYQSLGQSRDVFTGAIDALIQMVPTLGYAANFVRAAKEGLTKFVNDIKNKYTQDQFKTLNAKTWSQYYENSAKGDIYKHRNTRSPTSKPTMAPIPTMSPTDSPITSLITGIPTASPILPTAAPITDQPTASPILPTSSPVSGSTFTQCRPQCGFYPPGMCQIKADKRRTPWTLSINKCGNGNRKYEIPDVAQIQGNYCATTDGQLFEHFVESGTGKECIRWKVGSNSNPNEKWCQQTTDVATAFCF